jgi:hypothetical protein
MIKIICLQRPNSISKKVREKGESNKKKYNYSNSYYIHEDSVPLENYTKNSNIVGFMEAFSVEEF